MEILMSIAMVLVAILFIVLCFAIYLTITIFTGKSRNNKEYAPVHATIFDLFLHSDDLYTYETEIARTKPTFRFLSPGQSEILMALLHFFRFKMADETSKVKYKRMLTLHVEGGLNLCAIPRTST